MSDTRSAAPPTTPPPAPPATPSAARPIEPSPWRAPLAWLVVAAVLLPLPLYLEAFWLQAGLFVMAAAVGAIGLNILTGTTGQLSLAHAFFLALGAYGYAFFSGQAGASGSDVQLAGLGLPPVIGAVAAVATTGLAGLAFSPVAMRLRGIYLGVASLSLVFLGQHLLFNVEAVTGGFYGRQVPVFAVPGFTFGSRDPELSVLGVPFGPQERLWYLFIALLVGSALFARNVLASRAGRAMAMVRDSEVASSVMGISVRRYKTGAFVFSSIYAGIAGVMIGLAFSRVVPENFGLTLSVEYLAMIVIGGLGSVGGAAVGAAFVTALPLVLTHYSDSLPLLAEPGSGGVDAAVASRFLYGAAVVLVVLVEPGGLVALAKRLRPRRATP